MAPRPAITTHADRRAALDGADYVINMVQIGGHEATLLDFEIPARYGLRQTIADTLGIGGIFRTLRTADHMLALGREMAELCPRAWLLNYTNPMAMLCWLVYGGTPTQNVVGLCHSVQFTTEDLAELVGVPHRGGHLPRRRAQPPGVHPPLRARRGGSLPAPRRAHRLRPGAPAARARRSSTGGSATSRPSRASTLPSTCPWFMRHDDQIERYRIPVDEYIRRSEENLVEFERVKGVLAARRGDAARALERVRRRRSSTRWRPGEPCVIYGNVRNTGLLPGLPDDCCVEVPCLVDGTGLHPVAVPDYPPQLAALNRTFVNVVELTVRAVLEGRPELVRQAAMLDPNTAATLTLDEIDALCDELTRAHGDALPAALRATARRARRDRPAGRSAA